MSTIQISEGSGYFLHDKMPGCCLPNQTAATAQHFIALNLKPTLQQETNPCFAFSAGNSRLLIASTGVIILSCKKHPDPSNI
jgi:hypothetical protein